MNGDTSTLTRCPTCGRATVSSGSCSACGFIAARHHQEIVASAPASLITPQVFELSSTAGIRQSLATSIAGARRSIRNDPWLGLSWSETSGRVIIARQAPHEPMDFDLWRWVAIPVWGLLLLASPVAISVIVWWAYGFVAALIVGFVLLLILRYVFSDRLLQSWHLTAALNGRHIVKPMPVLMLRLRQWDGREVQLRVKGQLHGGTLLEGDRIRATGRWRSGVFRVRSVFCERTGAVMTPHQPNASVLALIGSVLLLLTSLWLWLGAFPWAMARLDEARSSWSHQLTLPPSIKITP
jgi:hypothetical protein